MIRLFRRLAWLLPLPLLVGCGSVLGYEEDYELGGAAGAGAAPSGGSAGAGTAGRAGATSAGNAGAAGSAGANGGNAGANGGSAGASGGSAGANGGSAGANGGSAGANGGSAGANGGSAGANGGSAGANGGSAGASGGSAGANGGSAGANGGSAGNAGMSVGGNAGTTNGGSGGSAGTNSGGNPGGGNGGNAGTTSGGSAGTTGGAGAGQGGTSSAGSGGAGGGSVVNPTDCSVIYVSPQGNLSNDGCSPAQPVINPLQGISRAQAQTKEIRICEGNYPGGFTLAANLSLKGSYDCTNWSRAPLSADAPLTKITSTGSATAIFVSGNTITRDAVIEGLFIQGGSGSTRSRALVVQGGARPTVRQNLIASGDAKGSGAPLSVALSLEVDAAPRVENNVIVAGNGEASTSTSSSTVASVGVAIDSLVGPSELVGNRIRSGNALLNGKGYGTFGIYVEPLASQALTGVSALRDNVIESGVGRDDANVVEILSGGIFFDETSSARGTVEIVGGVIVAGRAEHAGTPAAGSYPTAAGIFSGNHVSLTVDHARIYGGDSSVVRGTSMALNVSGTGSTTVLGSALHGGGVLADTPYPRALESRSSGTLTVTASTLFSGVARAVGGGPAGGTGIYLANPGRIVLRNNFFVMHAAFTVGIQLSGTCSAPTASTLSGNAFGSLFPGHSLFEGERSSDPACLATEDTLPGLAARFPTAAGNLRITPDPNSATELDLACTTGADCGAKLLTTFTTEAALRTSVITASDGSFTPKACALRKPAAGTALTTTDLLGNPVPPTSPTVGALQVLTETCQ